MGIDANALAGLIGVSEDQLHDFETGAKRIDADTLFRFCLALNVTAGFFVVPPERKK